MDFTSSLQTYKIRKIKKSFDTEISELSGISDPYDYIPVPHIQITSPERAEQTWRGDTYTISWKDYSPELFLYEGVYFGEDEMWIRAQGELETGSFSWNIPIDVSLGDKYKIRVSGSDEGDDIYFDSEEFEIRQRFLKIQPTNIKKIRANVGNRYTILWDADGLSNYLKVQLISSGALSGERTETTLDESFFMGNNTSTYVYEPSFIESGSMAYAKIKITDGVNNLINDETPWFSVEIPYIKSVIPVGMRRFNPRITFVRTGDENIRTFAGRIHNVQIIGMNVYGNVYIRFSGEMGRRWTGSRGSISIDGTMGSRWQS